MTEQITELTESQMAAMPAYRDKWIDIGLSCDRVNFEMVKVDLIKSYECAGRKPPQKIEFARGPEEAIHLIKAEGKRNGLTLTSSDILNTTMFGSQEAGWLSFYNFFEEQCDIAFPIMEGLNRLAHSSGWITVYDTYACIQDKPLCIKFDDQNRLHCENGPAIEYGDGTVVYSWHGVGIPDAWIADKENALTAEIALTWSNIEQRRAACEILGWVKVLEKLNAKIIDEDEDPMIGTLLQVNIPDIGKEQFLRVLCGTGREFAIPVPPDVKTALEANAWSYNMPLDVFGRGPEIRT